MNTIFFYPILTYETIILDNIFINKLTDNCIDIKTELSESCLNETLKDYFYKIGFFNTFLILDTSLDFEVIL